MFKDNFDTVADVKQAGVKKPDTAIKTLSADQHEAIMNGLNQMGHVVCEDSASAAQLLPPAIR